MISHTHVDFFTDGTMITFTHDGSLFSWAVCLGMYKKNLWQWGRDKFWYDGPITSMGLGPIFYVVFHS